MKRPQFMPATSETGISINPDPSSISMTICTLCGIEGNHIHWYWDWKVQPHGNAHQWAWMGPLHGVIHDIDGVSLDWIWDVIRSDIRKITARFRNELSERIETEIEVMISEKVWNEWDEDENNNPTTEKE